MSSSDGCCLPFSSLDTLVKCQPVRAASWRPDRPASLRISRSRPPRASRACSSCLGKAVAGSEWVVACVRCCDGPDRLERGLAESHGVGVGGEFLPGRPAVSGEVVEEEAIAVEEPG